MKLISATLTTGAPRARGQLSPVRRRLECERCISRVASCHFFCRLASVASTSHVSRPHRRHLLPAETRSVMTNSCGCLRWRTWVPAVDGTCARMCRPTVFPTISGRHGGWPARMRFERSCADMPRGTVKAAAGGRPSLMEAMVRRDRLETCSGLVREGLEMIGPLSSPVAKDRGLGASKWGKAC